MALLEEVWVDRRRRRSRRRGKGGRRVIWRAADVDGSGRGVRVRVAALATTGRKRAVHVRRMRRMRRMLLRQGRGPGRHGKLLVIRPPVVMSMLMLLVVQVHLLRAVRGVVPLSVGGGRVEVAAPLEAAAISPSLGLGGPVVVAATLGGERRRGGGGCRHRAPAVQEVLVKVEGGPGGRRLLGVDVADGRVEADAGEAAVGAAVAGPNVAVAASAVAVAAAAAAPVGARRLGQVGGGADVDEELVPLLHPGRGRRGR